MTPEVVASILILSGLCFVIYFGGMLADYWEEHIDARNRNPRPRR